MPAKRTELVEKHKIKIKEQARQQADLDKTELVRLADSMLVEQLQPIGLTPDYTLCWGERRVRAALLHDKITHLWAVFLDQPMTESQFRVLQLTENVLRADLTAAEKTKGIAELKRLNPGWTNKDVAEHLKIDASQVTRLLSVFDCVPEVQNAYFAGQIHSGAVYGISKLPADQQLEALAMALAGATREQIERHGKKQRNGTQETVRLSRFKYPLASGVEITVAGKELSLSDLIDALAELMKEAKRAGDQGLDIRTLVAVARDKAKKGA
jgi:ParB/RepB/Spo0J family partition protein